MADPRLSVLFPQKYGSTDQTELAQSPQTSSDPRLSVLFPSKYQAPTNTPAPQKKVSTLNRFKNIATDTIKRFNYSVKKSLPSVQATVGNVVDQFGKSQHNQFNQMSLAPQKKYLEKLKEKKVDQKLIKSYEEQLKNAEAKGFDFRNKLSDTALKIKDNAVKQSQKADQYYQDANLAIENPKNFKEFLTSPGWVAKKVVENSASLLTSIGISGTTLALTKNPQLALMAGFGSSFSQEGGSAYISAREYGLDDRKAQNVANIVGVANGTLEMLPIGRVISRLPQGNLIKNGIMKNVASLVIQASLEGGTESMQEIIGNAIAMTYDENQKLFEGVPESFIIGLATGGVTDIATTGASTTANLISSPNKKQQELNQKVELALSKPEEARTEEEKEIVEAVKSPAKDVRLFDEYETVTQTASKYNSPSEFAQGEFNAKETDSFGFVDPLVVKLNTEKLGVTIDPASVQKIVSQIQQNKEVPLPKVEFNNGIFEVVEGADIVTAFKVAKKDIPVINLNEAPDNFVTLKDIYLQAQAIKEVEDGINTAGEFKAEENQEVETNEENQINSELIIEAKKYKNADDFIKRYYEQTKDIEFGDDPRTTPGMGIKKQFVELAQQPQYQKMYDEGKKDNDVLKEMWNVANNQTATKQSTQPETKKNVETLTQDLRDLYKTADQEKLGDAWMQTLELMDVAQAGSLIWKDGKVVGGIKSTFPSFVPEELRSRELFDKVLSGLQDPNELVFPPAHKTKQQALYEAFLAEVDSQLGTDSSEIINQIKEAQNEERQNAQNTKQARSEKVASGSAEGSQADSKLIKEARKYKSAEEFIEAQGISVFHGTSKKFDTFSKDYIGENQQADYGDGVYFTDNKSVAQSFAKDAGGDIVMEAVVDIKNPATNEDLKDPDIQNAIDDDMGFKDVGEVLAEKGFDGVKFTHSDGSIEYVVYDVSKIKTKQQLTDIWNQAQNDTTKVVKESVPETLNETVADTRGKARMSRVAERVYEQLLDINPDLDPSSLQYQQMRIADQVALAEEFTKQNPEEALLIAQGRMVSPPNIDATAINIFVSEQALEKGDTKLWSELITKWSFRQTRMGQTIVLEKARSSNRASDFVKKVIQARMEIMANKKKWIFEKGKSMKQSFQEGVDEEVKILKKKIDEKVLKKLTSAQELINSLTCK
jgi:hypothetical protein